MANNLNVSFTILFLFIASIYILSDMFSKISYSDMSEYSKIMAHKLLFMVGSDGPNETHTEKTDHYSNKSSKCSKHSSNSIVV